MVTLACDPSGGIIMVGHGFGLLGAALTGLYSGLPYPSWELAHEEWAKACSSWALKRRVLREAGFTEQRQPPSLVSGRITGQCPSGPLASSWANSN
ncbi:Cyclin-dependent kinase 12 [Bienertia sinuspersici]